MMDLNQIIQGDCLTVLKTLPDKLVQCVVTSPPYWGLRDYGEAGQLGLEATPEEYVARMVEIFAELRRVMRDDGTLWLNLGDSYSGSGRGRDADGTWNPGKGGSKQATNTGSTIGRQVNSKSLSKNLIEKGAIGNAWVKPPRGYKPKDLCGIPWRVAFALQADGWYLRSDIIWSKPNPMPESVTDRPTKAHEYLFLLTKKARYYYDADAVREAHQEPGRSGKPENMWSPNVEKDSQLISGGFGRGKYTHRIYNPSGRNRRTVWEIATQPYPEAHFATFPEKLVEPCILAGSNDRACGICGAAWERNIEVSGGAIGKGGWQDEHDEIDSHVNTIKNEGKGGHGYERKTLGFRPTCEHDNGESRSIILDPFMGSGTVALVALKHGRDYLGIELKSAYIAMAMKRLKPLGNRPAAQQAGLKI